MNPPIFRGSKVAEYTHDFIDEVYKIVCALGVTSRKKVELDSYQLKDVAKLWYTHWKGNRLEELVPIEWEEFKDVFLGKYFPREMREVKVEEFFNLKQGSMSVEE